MNEQHTERADELLARWTEATDRPVPRLAPPVTYRRTVTASLRLSIIAVLVVLAALTLRGQPADVGRPAQAGAGPVGACLEGAWEVVPVDCESARRSVSWGVITLTRTRIWLTTVGAVKSAFNPPHQVVSDPPADRAVWLFVYDGYKRGVTYQDESGKLTTSAAESRWLHVADATDPTTVDGAFLYIYGWSELGSGNLDVPERFPLPLVRDGLGTPLAPRPSTVPGPSLLTPPPSLSGDALTAWRHAATFERARASGHWTAAWFHLSDRSKLQIGGVERFLEMEAARNAAGGSTFEIDPPVHDPELGRVPADMRPDISREADASRGYVVRIHHPRAQRASSATVQLYVAPLRSGDEWRIWILSN